MTMEAGLCSTALDNWRNCFSASFCTVMSRETPMMPMIFPVPSNHGIFVLDTQVTCPSFHTSRSSLPIIGRPVRMMLLFILKRGPGVRLIEEIKIRLARHFIRRCHPKHTRPRDLLALTKRDWVSLK